MQYDWWPNKKEEIRAPTDTEGRPRESIRRRQPFRRLGKKRQSCQHLDLELSTSKMILKKQISIM